MTTPARCRREPAHHSLGAGRQRNILEYQVRQTPRGAAISIRCTGDVNEARLHSGIVEGLAALGLEDPDVSISKVDRFERQPTGKLKRFLPLATP